MTDRRSAPVIVGGPVSRGAVARGDGGRSVGGLRPARRHRCCIENRCPSPLESTLTVTSRTSGFCCEETMLDKPEVPHPPANSRPGQGIMRDAAAAGAATRLHFAREKGNARLTSRTPLAPDRKRPGTAKSHAGPRGPVPPARRTASRNAEKAIRKTGRAEKRPQISAFHAENGPPAKEPQIPKGG
jgi:hypothetical protein